MPTTGGTSTILLWAAGLGLAALTSYFTTKGTIETRIAVVEERESGHFQEVQRGLTDLKGSIKELQGDIRYAFGARPTSSAYRESEPEQAVPSRAQPTPVFGRKGRTTD